MFNFSGSEIVFLLILGLVVLGPEKLPGVLRRAGRLYGEFKRMTTDAQSEMRRAFAEPMRDLQQTVSSYKTEFEAGARSVADDLRSDPPQASPVKPTSVPPAPQPPMMDPLEAGGSASDGAPGAAPEEGRQV